MSDPVAVPDPAENREEIAAMSATERLTKWATGEYRADRARFPFGVYRNPPELKADLLALLVERQRDKEALRISYPMTPVDCDTVSGTPFKVLETCAKS